MKRNKTRNIKFALATTLAFVFMLAMSVTTLASTTVRLAPSPYGVETGGTEISMDLLVDVGDVGIGSLTFIANWSPDELTAVFRQGMDLVWQGDAGLEAEFNNPQAVAEGNATLTFTPPMAFPPVNATQSGVAGRIGFNFPGDAENVTINLIGRPGESMTFVGNNLEPMEDPVLVGGTFNRTNLIWRYYSAGADARAFIRYAVDTVQNAAWVDFFYGQVVPAARALEADADGARALEMLLEWIEAA